jgi:hypothetical protein
MRLILAIGSLLLTLMMIPRQAVAQTGELPPVLLAVDGQTVVASADEWRQSRRGELLELFRTHVYGRVPAAEWTQEIVDVEPPTPALNGAALRQQATIRIHSQGRSLDLQLLMYLPNSATEKPAPTFAILNFLGNHTVADDPGIRPRRGELPPAFATADDSRGARASRFPVEQIVGRGYGVATMWYGDIDPDVDDGFENGCHALLESPGDRSADSWGSVAGWAWGMSRMADYLATNPLVDNHRIAAAGHSRLGKTALWAGAQDERFSLVISNNSGCTGAALARRKHGERVKAINDRFPHWFCENYRQYNDREDSLPVDQHQLLALVAPRLLYVASASQDDWADPQGEFAACVAAAPAFALFGKSGLPSEQSPAVNTPIAGAAVGYHLRQGKHDLTEYDWQRYIDFADQRWHGASD